MTSSYSGTFSSKILSPRWNEVLIVLWNNWPKCWPQRTLFCLLRFDFMEMVELIDSSTGWFYRNSIACFLWFWWNLYYFWSNSSSWILNLLISPFVDIQERDLFKLWWIDCQERKLGGKSSIWEHNITLIEIQIFKERELGENGSPFWRFPLVFSFWSKVLRGWRIFLQSGWKSYG